MRICVPMPRLIATYKWELLIIAGLIGSYVAIWVASPHARVRTDATLVALVLLGLRAGLMGALYFRLRRYGYGLEFMLLAGVSFVAGIASTSYVLAIPYLARYFENAFALISLASLDAPLTAAIFLAVLHRYVQRAHGGFIRLAHGLLLVVAVVEAAIVAYQIAPLFRVSGYYITAALLLGGGLYAWRLRPDLMRLVWAAAFAAVVVHLAVAALDPPLLLIRYEQLIYSDSSRFLSSELLTMLLVLWFARRASGLSLAHAFFIAAMVFSLPLSRLFEVDLLQGADETPLRVLASAAINGGWAALSISTTLAAVWMLGEFDRRGAMFRKRAAAALFGIRAALGVGGATVAASRGVEGIAQDAPLALGIIVGWGATIALVYLVRERRPAPGAADA